MSILDQLAVELSLDPAKFIEGVKKALEASKKGQEQILKGTQGIEDQTKKSADAVGKLSREFQSFFAVIGGALGVGAIKSLVDHMAMADAAVGRLSANLGTSAQGLSAWGSLAERFGGNAQEAQSSIAGLRSRIFNLANFGTNPGNEFWIGLSRGGVKADFMRTKDPMEQMFQVSKAIQNIAAREGRPNAYQFAKSSFGLDEGSTNVILGSRTEQELRANLAKIVKEIAPTDKDVANAQKLQESWVKLRQEIEALARLSYDPVIKFLNVLTGFVKVLHGESVSDVEREMSDNPDSYLHPNVFRRYYNRVMKKGGYSNRVYDGSFGSGRLGRFLGYGSEPDYTPSTGSSEATPEASAAGSGMDTSAQATGGGSPYLAATRASYFAELDRDPQLRRDVIKAASMEGGLQSNIEQMVNYSQMRGFTSLRQALHSGFYGPVNRGGLRFGMSKGTREAGERAIANVRGGSNMIDYRTDQGLWSDPNGGWYRNHPGLARWKKVEGANFFDFRGRGPQWAAEQREKERQYNADHATPPDWRSYWVDPSLYGAGLSPRTASSYSNQTTSTSQMFLNGPITVQTQATNADGFARDLRPAIEAQTNTFHSNDGAH